MKKIAAIILIALFLFNLVGYRFVFDIMQQQHDLQLQAALDVEDYNENELVTLSIPTNMPYQSDRTNFERVDGEINFEGKIYKYVKRKISEGRLVLLCLPDQNKMRLQSAKEDFFKSANDLVQSSQSKKSDHSKSNFSKKAASDYINDLQTPLTALPNTSAQQFTCLSANYFPASPHTIPGQPPDALV